MGVSLDQLKKTPSGAQKKAQPTTSWKQLLSVELSRSTLKEAAKESIYAELALLLEAGLNLKAALDLLVEQQKKPKVKALLSTITQDLTKGDRFSEAVRKHKAFSTYEYFSLKIGEETGNLREVLHKLSHFYLQKIEQRRALIGALTYPFIVMCTAVLAVGFMLTFMVPLFSDIFGRVGGELPALTRFVINLSEHFASGLGILFLLVVGVFFLHRYFTRFDSYKQGYYAVLIRIPVVGPFLRTTYMLRFTESMTLLINARVPLIEALELSNKMVRFYPLSNALEGIGKMILKGKTLEEGMRAYPIFDVKTVSLVKVGEASNQLHLIFRKLSDQLEGELKHRAKVLGNIVEPLIIVFLGFVVALILISMYLPMFELSASFGR
jgi:type IV pilus assembly protein PilC